MTEKTRIEIESVRAAYRVVLVCVSRPQRWVLPAASLFVHVRDGSDLELLPADRDRKDLPKLFEDSDGTWQLQRREGRIEPVYFGEILTLGTRKFRLEAEPVSGHDARTPVANGLHVRMAVDGPDEPGCTHVVGITDTAASSYGPIRGRSHRLWSRMVVLEALRGSAVHRSSILQAVWGPAAKAHTFDQTKSVLNRECGLRGLPAPLTNQRPEDPPGTWRLCRSREDRFTITFGNHSLAYDEIVVGRHAVLPDTTQGEQTWKEAWEEICYAVRATPRLKKLLHRIRAQVSQDALLRSSHRTRTHTPLSTPRLQPPEQPA